MNRTRVFVSSTFFDLEQVREDIKSTITGLGHEPFLSEYQSFPILPDLSTIENCKRVVRGCDLFVLIIGGRRGSLDPKSGRTIVNLEYETAQQQGISSLVFVHDTVKTLLPVWRKNPDADFSPHVDDPQVFKFVDGIGEKQQWTFTFSKASEISDTLRTQMSVLLKSLLDRRTTGRLDPLLGFEFETERARDIAVERPRLWEYLLTAELLRSKIATLKRDYDDLDRGLVYKPKKRVKGSEYFNLLSSKMGDPVTLSNIIKKSLEQELTASWGKPGEPGDPILVLRSVNRSADACKSLLDWEVEISALDPQNELGQVGSSLRGMTQVFIDELARLPDELEAAVEGTGDGTKQVSINLVFPAPPQLKAFGVAMEEVKRHPEWYAR